MNTITDYKIYLVNKGVKAKTFWCFLDTPDGLIGEKIYANSSIMLSVPPNYQGLNLFTIPYQYQVAADTANIPPRLGVINEVSIMKNAPLQSSWRVSYATAPLRLCPLLDLVQNSESPENTISIETNSYNSGKNHEYNNISLGIKAKDEEGFTGITWVPSPNNKYIITPKFSFYITTGNYASNVLTSIDEISKSSAAVLINDFKNFEATVTLEVNGDWTVTPGTPPQHDFLEKKG